MVLGAIDAHGNKIWSTSLGEHCMSSSVILTPSGKKLVEGQLWAEVTQVTIWGHMKVLPSMCQVISDHFCLGVIFYSVTFLHSKW